MFTNIFRVGRDADLRYTPQGKPVTNVSMAYDIGFGERKRAGWIEVAIWGDRAETLAPMLTKGVQVFCVIDDLEVETFERQDGSAGAKLKGRLVDLKFAGSRQGGGGTQRPPQQQAPSQAPPPQQQDAEFPDDDIPF